MTFDRRLISYGCVLVLLVMGCKLGDRASNSGNGNNANRTSRASASPTPVTSDAGVTGVEKQKPSPGMGNVQGKVVFNGQPVGNNDVQLCEKFNRFGGTGCSGGKVYEAKTDKDGVYVIANAPPATYEALRVRVFNTNYWVFSATSFGISASKYEVKPDHTLFVEDTALFKNDLKTISPKAGSKVSGQGLELKWNAYPDAAYYKFSLYASEPGVTSPYINQRVDDTSFTLDKPMPKGEYRWELEAYNDDDQKLSENANNISFTITDGQ